MSKIKVTNMDAGERRVIVGELLDVISNIKNREEMFEFLFRLMTPSEVIMLARRMQIAKLLLTEKSYEEIRKQLGVSHRTIADVEGWLRENQMRAKMVHKKFEALEKKTITKNPSSMADKYWHHRFVKDLFS